MDDAIRREAQRLHAVIGELDARTEREGETDLDEAWTLFHELRAFCRKVATDVSIGPAPDTVDGTRHHCGHCGSHDVAGRNPFTVECAACGALGSLDLGDDAGPLVRWISPDVRARANAATADAAGGL